MCVGVCVSVCVSEREAVAAVAIQGYHIENRVILIFKCSAITGFVKRFLQQ